MLVTLLGSLQEFLSPAPRCPSCGEDVSEYDGEQFCLDVACEEMVVEAEQPEPPDVVRDVLVPMWPAVVWTLLGWTVLPQSFDGSFFDLAPHQQAYSLLFVVILVFSMVRAGRRAENVD
jgi:hypothetical protein